MLASKRFSGLVVSFLVSFFSSSLVVQATEIEFFSPSGEVKNVRQVIARFAEPMVAFGDPREVAPFDVACPAAGRGRWADPRNWIYDFDNDLSAGIACGFKLKEGLLSANGKPVKGGEQFSFNTGGPTILQSKPRKGSRNLDENQVFILGLDAPATVESIEKNASCLAEGISEQIPVKLITGDERKAILEQQNSFLTTYYSAIFKRGDSGRAFVFGVEEKGSAREKFLKLRDGANSPIVVLQCLRTLPNDANVRLLWEKGILSVSGIPTSSPHTLEFSIRPAFIAKFSCERTSKDADCIPVLPMRLTFSAPVSTKDAQKVRLVAANSKAIPAVISEEDKKIGFTWSLTFPAPLPGKTMFKIEMPGGLKDDTGRILANASSFPLTVRTDDDPPLAKFAAHFGILELKASSSTPPLLPVTLRNVEPSLAASIATTRQNNATSKAIDGHVARVDQELDAVAWLHRLENIDNPYSEPGKKLGMISIFKDNDKRKSFTITKPLGRKAFEVVGIPLKDPGFYVVELKSPRLGAVLHGENRPYYAHAAALVTNLSVHFKQGRESSLVWVTRLDKGDPVPDAAVAIRDCSGKIYHQGRTDAQGIFRVEQKLLASHLLPACITTYDRQYFVTARSGKDFSFVFPNWNQGITLWRFNAYQNSWEGNTVAHAVMDRTLLRAGETAHIKLFVRRKTRSSFAKTDEPLPESVNIEHQGSNEKYPVRIKWDVQGVSVFDWQIPKDAKQGSYVIQIPKGKYGGKIVGDFRVENFRIPIMQAILQGPDKPLVNAEKTTVAIQVNYLAGGGAADLPVKLRGQLHPKSVTFSDYEDYVFANGNIKVGPEKIGSEPWYEEDYELTEPDDEEPGERKNNNKSNGRLLPTQSLQLDAAGAGQATFAEIPKSPVPQNLQTELEYRDPNGEILTVSSRIPLWPSNIVVGIKPDSVMATKDHLKFYVLVLDLKGKPVQGTKVRVAALEREYFSHRRRLLGGFYAFENRREVKALGDLCHGTTDNKGLLVCDVKSPAAGNIILQANAADADGNDSSANREIWVAGDHDRWFDASDNDRIDLLPEKKRYEPGETARLQLRMPFKEAMALVTVEREGVMESFVTRVTRDNPMIEVPIKNNYAPNTFISALVVRGRVQGIKPTAMIDLAKPAFKMGLAEINVGWAAHELKVKVTTDKAVYKVREKTRVAIDVRRGDGSAPPPGSEVALTAVDEGLLELKPNDSWKLLDAMMTRRGIEVETSTAQMQVIGKRHFGRKALAAGGSGGRSPSRELFDTLLFWQARIKLDADGHAEAVIPLNDSLTSFRIVAVANGDLNLFGTGSASVRATQDLMLLSGLPPVVREQDSYRAGFTVRNAGDRPVAATVTARLNNGAKNKTGDAQKIDPIDISLQAGEARDIGWNITAPVGSERLQWDVAVREKGVDENGDRLKVGQKVIPAVPVRTLQATMMQLENPELIEVKLPAGAIPERGGVEISFRKHLSDGLSGVREFMARYPYTCFEQNASKAIALQDKNGWKSLMNTLPANLDRDGLVKYFPVMTEGDDTLTAYLLSIADEAGYEIPDDAHGKMLNGLAGFVEGRVIRNSVFPTMDLNLRRLAAISALSRKGRINQKWFDSISVEPNLWPTSAVLDWLSILKQTPNFPMQAKLLTEAQQILRSRLNFQGTTMRFSTERSDALWWLMISSDVNANRALLAFLDMDEWRPDIPRLVQGTLGRQQEGHWNTTVANAWGTVAMKKFSGKFETTPVAGVSTAAIEKEHFAADWAKEENGARKMLAWPATATALNLSHDGSGRPWVTIQSLAALPLKEPLFTGYRIARTIVPVDQKESGAWHKGDVARIRLDIEAQSDMTWVVVNDPIPAGATILGTGLGGDSKILTHNEKKGWVWPTFEERAFDGFHAYYRFMPKGKMSLEYTLRLNNEGTFNLPPTRVEAMYAPEMFGELPNAHVVVLP